MGMLNDSQPNDLALQTTNQTENPDRMTVFLAFYSGKLSANGSNPVCRKHVYT